LSISVVTATGFFSSTGGLGGLSDELELYEETEEEKKESSSLSDAAAFLLLRALRLRSRSSGAATLGVVVAELPKSPIMRLTSSS
jgi:hypothetical protein